MYLETAVSPCAHLYGVKFDCVSTVPQISDQTLVLSHLVHVLFLHSWFARDRQLDQLEPTSGHGVQYNVWPLSRSLDHFRVFAKALDANHQLKVLRVIQGGR